MHQLGEETWAGRPLEWCGRGSFSATARQARRRKPAEWWGGMRGLLERDGKIRHVSGLRMAHVLERLWLHVFSQVWGACSRGGNL